MIIALIFLGILAIIVGLFLGLLAKKFSVKSDKLVDEIFSYLPGLDCGACGYAGCRSFAEELGKNPDLDSRCGPGGDEVMTKIAKTLGKEILKCDKCIARIKCSGGNSCKDNFSYDGIKSCRASLLVGNIKECSYGCIGFFDCINSCKFGAISIGENNLPVVDKDKCTSCGSCVRSCPKGLFVLTPLNYPVYVSCESKDIPKKKSKYCSSGCIGCGICEKSCPKGAIKIVDNIPVFDYSKCVGCGICAQKCPRKVIFFRGKNKNK
jgi:Na+-translocating ferredoxin:NAD+ oxidoreductase subunit B